MNYTTIRNYKEVEYKTNEQFYNNLMCLKTNYPFTKELKMVVKKDMFVKNNKAAFQQVIYFLLTILNPELTKEMLTSWPPFDITREKKFRNEILIYINKLNTIYEHANITVLMASHFVSPGGYKFVKFMLKLSQLVLFEHLRRDGEIDELLYCLSPIKNKIVTNLYTDLLKENTDTIRKKTAKLLEEWQNQREKASIKAKLIENEQGNLNEQLRDLSKNYNRKQMEFQKKYPKGISIDDCFQKINALTPMINYVNPVLTSLSKSLDLLVYADRNHVLKYDPDLMPIPKNYDILVKTEGQFDLVKYVDLMHTLFEQRRLSGISLFEDNDVKLTLKTLEIFYDNLSIFRKRLSEKSEKLQTFSKLYKTKTIEDIKNLMVHNDDILAVPLDF